MLRIPQAHKESILSKMMSPHQRWPRLLGQRFSFLIGIPQRKVIHDNPCITVFPSNCLQLIMCVEVDHVRRFSVKRGVWPIARVRISRYAIVARQRRCRPSVGGERRPFHYLSLITTLTFSCCRTPQSKNSTSNSPFLWGDYQTASTPIHGYIPH
jgi:hypothetical protein